jgi:hypothetical protein
MPKALSTSSIGGTYENNIPDIWQTIRAGRQKKDSGSARKEKQQIRKNVPPPESP